MKQLFLLIHIKQFWQIIHDTERKEERENLWGDRERGRPLDARKQTWGNKCIPNSPLWWFLSHFVRLLEVIKEIGAISSTIHLPKRKPEPRNSAPFLLFAQDNQVFPLSLLLTLCLSYHLLSFVSLLTLCWKHHRDKSSFVLQIFLKCKVYSALLVQLYFSNLLLVVVVFKAIEKALLHIPLWSKTQAIVRKHTN